MAQVLPSLKTGLDLIVRMLRIVVCILQFF